MKYEFKIDGVAVDLEKFYRAINEVIWSWDSQWHELLDTGSIDLNGTVYSIEVAS